MVVLPAGAQVPPYAKKKGKLCTKCVSKTQVLTVDKTLKEEISKLSLTTENAFFKPFIILSCESSLPPHLKQRPTPCELGAVAYSMDTGLIDSWHQFIDPGILPMGFTYEAQFHSQETHKIPPTPFAYAIKDMQKTYTSLHTFVMKESLECTVFTLKSQQRHVQSAVDWIRLNSKQNLTRIRVLVLEDLLAELITLSGHKVPVYLTNELMPQHLKYLSNVCCAWHASQDYIVCAHGSAVRLGYASAALLYKYYDQIVWGPNHAPEDALEVNEYIQTRDLDDSESVVSRYLKANSAVHRLPTDQSYVDKVAAWDTNPSHRAQPASQTTHKAEITKQTTHHSPDTPAMPDTSGRTTRRGSSTWKPFPPPQTPPPSNITPRVTSPITFTKQETSECTTPSVRSHVTPPASSISAEQTAERPISSVSSLRTPPKQKSEPDPPRLLSPDHFRLPTSVRSSASVVENSEPATIVRPLIGRGRIVAESMRGRGVGMVGATRAMVDETGTVDRGRGLGRGCIQARTTQPGVPSRRPKPKGNIG